MPEDLAFIIHRETPLRPHVGFGVGDPRRRNLVKSAQWPLCLAPYDLLRRLRPSWLRSCRSAHVLCVDRGASWPDSHGVFHWLVEEIRTQHRSTTDCPRLDEEHLNT